MAVDSSEFEKDGVDPREEASEIGRHAGILVAHEDAEAIAGALRSLFTDPGRRDRMAAVARRHAPSLFWENVGARYLRLACDVVHHSKRARRVMLPRPPVAHLGCSPSPTPMSTPPPRVEAQRRTEKIPLCSPLGIRPQVKEVSDALHRIFRSIGDACENNGRRGPMHYCALLLLGIFVVLIAILVVLA